MFLRWLLRCIGQGMSVFECNEFCTWQPYFKSYLMKEKYNSVTYQRPVCYCNVFFIRAKIKYVKNVKVNSVVVPLFYLYLSLYNYVWSRLLSLNPISYKQYLWKLNRSNILSEYKISSKLVRQCTSNDLHICIYKNFSFRNIRYIIKYFMTNRYYVSRIIISCGLFWFSRFEFECSNNYEIRADNFK